jgi:ribonuclease T2
VLTGFQTLPTFQWLANQGITPDSSKTFTLKELTSALEAESGGFTPALDCDSGALNQISWYFNVKGSVIDGTFVPINAPEAGSCPSSGIKYPPKSGASPVSTTGGSSPTKTTSAGGGSPTGGALPAKATLVSSSVGGLLSAGTWSVQTLATYTLSGTSSGFTMTTSKGKCAVSGGQLTCGSSVSSASTFSAVSIFACSTAWVPD